MRGFVQWKAPWQYEGLGPEPNDFETMNPLLAARFGEVASYLAESLPRRAGAISAQRIHTARELKRVRRRLARAASLACGNGDRYSGTVTARAARAQR